MSNFKVGDRVIDLAGPDETWAQVEHIFKDSVGLRWEKTHEYFIVDYNDEYIITEEIYNSKLYQLMQEKE